MRSRADRNAFIRFPWRVYENDHAWVPPLIIERKAFFDRKSHPFYEHGDAALFLARQNGEVVGRIMASDDPNYNAIHDSNIGCFGQFECVDNDNVAAALFNAAEGWVRRKGRLEIMGPIDYSTNYVCGLLIDGFQYPPTILTAHNPTYYAELIDRQWIFTPGGSATRLKRRPDCGNWRQDCKPVCGSQSGPATCGTCRRKVFACEGSTMRPGGTIGVMSLLPKPSSRT